MSLGGVHGGTGILLSIGAPCLGAAVGMGSVLKGGWQVCDVESHFTGRCPEGENDRRCQLLLPFLMNGFSKSSLMHKEVIFALTLFSRQLDPMIIVGSF